MSKPKRSPKVQLDSTVKKSAANAECPDCSSDRSGVSRRDFLLASGALAAAAALPNWAVAKNTTLASEPESVVKLLFESLTDAQKKVVWHDWDYVDAKRGLLRTRVSNNWHINDEVINTDFYTAEQRKMIRDIYEGILQPEWHAKIDKQLEDDAGGWGEEQNIAIFGTPGAGAFEFVMTGRHMTLRCDGNSAEHVAFGGPIFYGHAADGFYEGPGHPGNVFWEQALEANKLFGMLDGKQQQAALVGGKLPKEESVAFRTEGFPGVPVTEFSADQKAHLQLVLQKLIEPYRQSDRDEVVACLQKQGGLDRCSLAFYSDGDVGSDRVWDNWRLEGPSFVWYFRGAPHVHVWVNVADDPSVKLNA